MFIVAFALAMIIFVVSFPKINFINGKMKLDVIAVEPRQSEMEQNMRDEGKSMRVKFAST